MSLKLLFFTVELSVARGSAAKLGMQSVLTDALRGTVNTSSHSRCGFIEFAEAPAGTPVTDFPG